MTALGRMHKTTVVVPLALLSAAWTVSLAGAGVTTTAAAGDPAPSLPDGSTVPVEAIEAPASLSGPTSVAPAVPSGSTAQVVSSSTASGIPEAALLAYQRAESVINAADKACNVSWHLIAAIGRVESDHGRFGGNALDADGVAQPGIYGIALDGTRGTRRITDTDAGQYDDDARFDRAVGPMQFIPSTWSVVGVDGDNDGVRNPQDVDDAALATAVYLCSGEGDLSTEQGQRASVYRYNHSNEYVDLVLAVMQAYLDGDFRTVPVTAVPVSVPDATATASPERGKGKGRDQGKDKGRDRGKGKDGDRDPSSSGDEQEAPTSTSTSTPTPTRTPTPTPTPTKAPTTSVPTKLPSVSATVPTVPLPTPTAPVLEPTLTWAQAQTQCLAQGISALDLVALNACINDLMGG